MPEEILGRDNSDFFPRERELFREVKQQAETGGLNERRLLDVINNQEKKDRISQFERENGLNEGDLLGAAEKLREDVGREVVLEKSQALEEATGPNVNPETGAELARFAGYSGIKTGEQFKAVKNQLKRSGKTLTDPKISAGVREKSLQQDRDEIDQILLRSTTQDGRRGVAVTGTTGAGRRAEDLGGLDSEPLTGGDTPGRFFPEPEKSSEPDLEQFMRTLEPETTLLRGQAGQRDIAGKKQRNKLRITERQAGQPKQVIKPEGAQIFETSPGQARALTKPSKRQSGLKKEKFELEKKKVKQTKRRLDLAEKRLKKEAEGKGITEGTVNSYIKNIRDTLGERDSFTGRFTGVFTPESKHEGWKRFVGLAVGMDTESGIKLAKSLRSLMDAPPPSILAAFPEYFPEAGGQVSPDAAQIQDTPEQIRLDFIAEGKTAEARGKARKRFDAIGFTGQ